MTHDTRDLEEPDQEINHDRLLLYREQKRPDEDLKHLHESRTKRSTSTVRQVPKTGSLTSTSGTTGSGSG